MYLLFSLLLQLEVYLCDIILNFIFLGCGDSTRTLVALGSDSLDVTLYDMLSGDASHKLCGHTSSITAAAWSHIQVQ